MSPHSTTDISTENANGAEGSQTNGTQAQGSIPAVEQGDGASTVVETDFLVVGCGPAGASLACFLASHG